MIGYYYCSVNTFFNIFRNREIYLSDPLKMNDRFEIIWYLNKLNDDLNTREGTDESIYERMVQRSGINFTFEELLDCIETSGQRSVYISCFSQKKDILSQWRAYADDGKGLSIGFDLDKLVVADNFFIEEIKYTDKIVEQEIENDVEIVADTINTVISENKIKRKDEKIRVFLHELIPELVKYKNPAFKEEKEVRLIYCDDLKFEKILQEHHALQNELNTKPLEHDFRVINNSDITEFVRLEFKPECISEICIGPKCLLKKNDILNISNKFLGNEPKVSISKSSYR